MIQYQSPVVAFPKRVRLQEWQFTSDGKCYDYYQNQLSDTYQYTITQEQSENGKFTLSYLKLVNINDSSDFYEYEINTLDNSTMVLDYLGDMSAKLTSFNKQ